MRCRRGFTRPGFTLVEVLVALGLLVLVVSLALPVALTNTAQARARTAERILKLSPAVARGEAQSRGLPVALMLRPSEDGTGLSLELVRQPDPQSDNVQDLEADPEDISTWPSVDEPRVLPRGTRLWEGELAELEAFEAETADATERGGLPPLGAFTEDEAEGMPLDAAAEPAEPVVLAWFLSDGSAMAGQATVVQLADGRVLRVRVEALTGRLAFTRAPELEEANEEGDEAQESPDDANEPAELPESPDERVDADEPGFDELEFDELGFEELGFEELEFEDLGGRFEREPESRRSRRDSDNPRERTNPQPPQPR